MDHNVPRSPFATRLSGSVKDTELRIRSIFSAPKKRPPVWLTVLAVCCVLFCGGLVSCQPMEPTVESPAPPDGSASSSVLPSSPDGPEASWPDPVETGPDVPPVVEKLFQACKADAPFDPSIPVHKERLTSFGLDGFYLTAAHFYDDYPRYSLVLGVSSIEGDELIGPVFQATASVGAPQVTVFQKDGKPHLLYTVNYSRQGYSGGEAGVVTLDGDQMTWVWPVKGDLRDKDSQAYVDYQTYWMNRMALLSPGGVDVFAENPDYGPYEGAPPQWTPDFNEQFYPVPEDELPIGVLYQTRLWLEQFTAADGDRSACCRLLSLTPAGTTYPGQKESETAYLLKACPDGDERGYFTATLIYNEDNHVDRMVEFACSDGHFVQTIPFSHPLYNQNFAAANALIADYLQQEYFPNRVYFPKDQPDVPQPDDWRIDSLTLRGEQLSGGVVKTAYQVDFSRCRAVGEEPDWFQMPSVVLTLSREEDGVFQKVLGHKAPAPYPATTEQVVEYYFDG